MKNTAITPKNKKKHPLLKLTPFLIFFIWGMITIGLLSCSGVRAAHFLPTSSSVVEIEVKAPTTFGKISGYAWEDQNQDGWKNENESWQHGSLLLKQNSEIIMEIYPSMLDGYYEIDSIPPGNYYLTSNASFPFILARGDYSVEIEEGTHLRDMHFVLVYYGSDEFNADLKGNVWYDTNNNGLYDTDELGADSIQVFAQLDSSSWYPTLDTMYIDTVFNGYYRFPLTKLGYYSVSIAIPEGYQTPQETYSGETGVIGMELPPNATGEHDNILEFNFPLYPINNDTTIEEESPPPSSSISGYVWIDEIANNERDESEIGNHGVNDTIVLTDLDGNWVDIVQVDSETGAYEIYDLTPGNYIVFLLEDGSSNITNSIAQHIVSLDLGEQETDQNFILAPLDVGLEPDLLETPLHAYPIPCQDFVNIYSIEFILTGYTIYNPTGQVIQSGSVDPNHEIQVDLPLLSYGIYNLELTTDTEGIIRREIVVMP